MIGVKMLDWNRQSGRTTRMLEEVIKAHKKGEIVVVVAVNQRHIYNLKEQLYKLVNDKDGGSIDVTSIYFLSADRYPSITNIINDYDNGTNKIFIDHFVAQYYIQKLEYYLHFWD